MNKVYCPKCGTYHEAQPLKPVLTEGSWEEVQDYSPEEDKDGDTVVTLTSAHIEAGPWDGDDSYLVDDGHTLCSCPECNNTFTTSLMAEDKASFSVTGIHEQTGQIVCDEIEAPSAEEAISAAAQERGGDYKSVVASNMKGDDLAFNDEEWKA